MKTSYFSHEASDRRSILSPLSNQGRATRAKRRDALRRACWRSVEALESRTLLSSVSGIVYSDVNLTGCYSDNDLPLAGVQVFDDLNNTGQYQSGDPSATTGSDGSYTMYHVPLNTSQSICVSLPTAWTDSPGDDDPTSVTLTTSNRHVTGVDFGLWQPIETLSVQNITIDEGDAYTGSVGTVTDSAGSNANPYDYSGVLSLNGTSTVDFQFNTAGNLVGMPDSFPNLAVGSYDATLAVTESSNGRAAYDSATFTVNVIQVPISAQGVNTSAETGIPWSGTIATFTDPVAGTQASNYAAVIDYGDGSEASVGTISSDGSGGWVVTDTHTFTSDQTFTPTVTIEASDYSGDLATATSTVVVTLAPISLSSSDVGVTESDSFDGTVGTLTDAAGTYATGNYQGSLSLDGSSCDVSFSSPGDGVYSVTSNDFPTLPVGSYSATLDVTETGVTSTACASSGLTVTVSDAPITSTPANISAVAGVPWTGTVATFDHADYNPQASNYTATILYNGSDTATGTISSNGSGGWIVTATLTYASPGNDSPAITIDDNVGGSVTVDASAAVTFAPLSLSASNLYLEQGQAFSGSIGLLTDSAGSYSNSANFSATLTWDGWIYSNLSLTSAGTGMWNLVTSGVAPLSTGTYSNSLTVTETDTTTGQSITTDPVSFSATVVSPSLYASGQYLSATVGQSWSGTLATVTDDDPYDQPDVYDTASTNYGDGSSASSSEISSGSTSWTVSGTHTFIEAGTLSPSTTISDGSGNVLATATGTANVNLATISLATSDAWITEGQSLSTAVGTLTDAAGAYASGNYTGSVTIDGGGSYPVTFVADGSNDGGYSVQASGLPLLSFGWHSATVAVSESSADLTQTVDTTSSFSIYVAAAALTQVNDTATTVSAVEGQSLSATLLHFTDADSYYQASNFAATVTWGDGLSDSTSSSSNVTIAADSNGGFDVIANHSFTYAGNYTISVSVQGTSGSTLSNSVAADISNAALTAASDSPTSITSVEAQMFSGVLLHFNDADPNGGTGKYTASIAWGDGTSDSNNDNATIVTDPNGGFDVVGTHTYTSAAAYSVSVTVLEAAGGEFSSSVSCSVAPAAPASLTATAVSSSEIDLTWTNQANTYDTIEIDRSTSPDGGFVAVTTLSSGTTSYADTALSSGTTYYYQIRAIASGVYSPASNTASDTTW